ncbi:TetR/AcrR family transcriptional regulator [Streptomyces sp. NPDC006798]|uniref:TetR/AcrR family transcriptional regulator n=1 Tax=Streptomyces sp. NPDC006798 TaxID=3155462 RepID=UPI0033CD9777
MPRTVDTEARRRRIADAVRALADEHGLEGVTLRDVAARAGVSMGAVQRCFRTKDEMLRFALTEVGERIGTRVRAGAGIPSAPGSLTGLARAVTEVALVDPADSADARVWLSFVAQAAVTDSLAAVLRADYAELEELFVRLLLRAAGPDGDREAEAVREARALLALADGLTMHVLVGHRTSEEAGEVVRTQLAALESRFITHTSGSE